MKSDHLSKEQKKSMMNHTLKLLTKNLSKHITTRRSSFTNARTIQNGVTGPTSLLHWPKLTHPANARLVRTARNELIDKQEKQRKLQKKH